MLATYTVKLDGLHHPVRVQLVRDLLQVQVLAGNLVDQVGITVVVVVIVA